MKIVIGIVIGAFVVVIIVGYGVWSFLKDIMWGP